MFKCNFLSADLYVHLQILNVSLISGGCLCVHVDLSDEILGILFLMDVNL